jgi:hypothetical protein
MTFPLVQGLITALFSEMDPSTYIRNGKPAQRIRRCDGLKRCTNALDQGCVGYHAAPGSLKISRVARA